MTARAALDPETRTWTVTFYARPWSVNEERRWHWSKRSAHVEEWRRAFGVLARQAKVPRLERIGVTVQPFYAKGQRPDVASCYSAAKAGIDGLTDSKVIPDDNPDHLAWQTFLPPVMGAARDALVLTIEVVA